MRIKLGNLNNCAVPLLSRATANLCCYNYNMNPKHSTIVYDPILPHSMIDIIYL